MLKRKITNVIEKWFNESDSALLIDGARQIGKTTTIREFLKNTNKKFIELNLIENKLALEAFNTAKDSKDLMLKISALSNVKLVKNETIIFIDEIQEANDAISPIKFLVQNTKFKFIFSGSLLGVKIQEILSIPIGFLKIVQMYPMDFEEFILAIGISERILQHLKECYNNLAKIDPIVHKQLMNLFYTYLVVGGMPKAVATFIETNNMTKVNEILKQIDLGYAQDITKYEKMNKLLIKDIYNLIPSELNSQNKRFILKNLNEKARFYKYETSFTWLKHSDVGLFVHNVDNPVYPLLASKERTLFKLFLSDVGLLTYKIFNGHQIQILNGDTSKNNYGAICESFVAQELKAHNYELYFHSNKKRGEIDFLIEELNEVIPIEVKSGKDYKRHSALNNLLSDKSFDIKKGIVFCNENIEQIGKIIYLPIYMTMFVQPKQYEQDQFVNINISELI
ncbi:ATP-binding protein [Mycoplasmopsis hyopharyngis]|uniref:ATP-binding protein n=1 Tax=Mycoplasmopsis hyopharyngis TaxID=29558 RepID=UPI003873B267